MKVLIVGSGAREAAIARALSSSPLLKNGTQGAGSRVSSLYIAPGNPGCAEWGSLVPIAADSIDELVDFADREGIDLVVPGPEAPLAAGIADALAQRSKKHGRRIACFGPSRAAAEIESSKAFAKGLMLKLGVPTALFAAYKDFEYAARAVETARKVPVIKASGLAAGKGVFLPSSKEEAVGILHSLLSNGSLGAAGSEVLLEERLEGEEISLMAFCDGQHIALMPSAQDHKRLLDEDEGPNTGGMGAYAPVPLCPPSRAAEWAKTLIEPVVKGLASMGRPFVGVLYAGLIVTEEGPKVLEYNCRFGDPETEAVLALLKSDLLSTLLACAEGRLGDSRAARAAEFGDGLPVWDDGAAASIVMAAPGYPENPRQGIPIILNAEEDEENGSGVVSGGTAAPAGSQAGASAASGPNGAYILEAGTAVRDGQLVSAGGRVLAVTAKAPSLEAALDAAYARLALVSFPGAQFRRDIGLKGLRDEARSATENRSDLAGGPGSVPLPKKSAYAAAGVDIDAGNEAVRLMGKAVRSTYGREVLAGIGSFGGLYDASALKAMKAPVLVSSTDGVGTKIRLAAQCGKSASVGSDIVNHCINDILVQGARPLFFLDYIASAKLNPRLIADAVSGMASACSAASCALIGGETAEMPGVYHSAEFDIAGAIVGLVEKADILPRPDIQAHDLIVGIASSGPHTNGYSLLRKIFADPETGKVDLSAHYGELGPDMTIGDALLAVHRPYLSLLGPILKTRPGLIKGLAHLTGGGFIENIPRILPPGLIARIRLGTWPVPPLFQLVKRLSSMDELELYRVFNMGIGMVAIVSADRVWEFRSLIPEETWIIGELDMAPDPREAARTQIVGLT